MPNAGRRGHTFILMYQLASNGPKYYGKSIWHQSGAQPRPKRPPPHPSHLLIHPPTSHGAWAAVAPPTAAAAAARVCVLRCAAGRVAAAGVAAAGAAAAGVAAVAMTVATAATAAAGTVAAAGMGAALWRRQWRRHLRCVCVCVCGEERARACGWVTCACACAGVRWVRIAATHLRAPRPSDARPSSPWGGCKVRSGTLQNLVSTPGIYTSVSTVISIY